MYGSIKAAWVYIVERVVPVADEFLKFKCPAPAPLPAIPLTLVLPAKRVPEATPPVTPASISVTIGP